MPTDSGRLVVLESYPAPHDRTTAYHVLLFDSLPDRIDARHFTWRRALLGDFDVFHLHWPEVKVRGATRLRTAIRTLLFTLLLVRIRVTGRALVRTLHDRTPHERAALVQRLVIRLSERWTTLWILLNDQDRPPVDAPTVRSRIGDYTSWFDADEVRPIAGRLLHFGLIRRYKGSSELLRAFEATDDPSLSLRVVGRAEEADLAEELAAAAHRDPRVSFRNEFVTDDELAREIRRSELVVLPFRHITNSSTLLVALSLDRPVLAPELALIAEVGEEVGPGWVSTYRGALTAADLVGAVEATRAAAGRPRPDLSTRSWSVVGEEHAAAFEEAVALVDRRCVLRRRRVGSPSQRRNPASHR